MSTSLKRILLDAVGLTGGATAGYGVGAFVGKLAGKASVPLNLLRGATIAAGAAVGTRQMEALHTDTFERTREQGRASTRVSTILVGLLGGGTLGYGAAKALGAMQKLPIPQSRVL